jgi:hypothetical protein
MDYEPKGPTKSMGVSAYPVYGIVYSIGVLAITIIGKKYVYKFETN